MVNWYIEPDAIATFHQGTACRAQLVFSGDGAVQAIAAAMERLIDHPVAVGVRAALADLPGLARWGELRREQLAVEGEMRQLQTTARRIDAERAEAVLLAAPGWSQAVVEKEAALKQMTDEFAGLVARHDAMKAPIEAARAVVERQARSARFQVSKRVQEELQARRANVPAKAGPQLGQLLSELVELESAIARGHAESAGAAMGGPTEAPGPFVDLAPLADRAAELAAAGRAAKLAG